MQRRQQELLPDLVHFLADDADDLVYGTLSEEQIRVNAGGELTDISGADQKFVARDFGVGRRFAQRGNKKLRPAVHVTPSVQGKTFIVAKRKKGGDVGSRGLATLHPQNPLLTNS